MHTPVVIANGDAMMLPCLFVIKACIPYDEVKLHIGPIKTTATRPTFSSLL